ncbi:hypothetical protein [Xanthomonas translucens]|nr:hypothetical protein [Xanthomonas translucens]UPU50294.1 hypothetical protein MZO50_07825 [Xanthomonas translucens pv. undulosa]
MRDRHVDLRHQRLAVGIVHARGAVEFQQCVEGLKDDGIGRNGRHAAGGRW